MRTVASTPCQEFEAVVDLLDAMEVCLPLDREVSEQQQKLDLWRHEIEFLKRTELPNGGRANGALAAIHELGAQLYIASVEWPKADTYDLDTHLYETKYVLTEQVGKNVADYSMSSYARMIDETLHRYDQFLTPKALKATLLYNKFSTDEILSEAGTQEFYALFKLALSEITDGSVKAPTSRELFDPTLVAVERHWRSVTQLETSISYDGQTLGRFGDDAVLHPLGHYQPKMSEAGAVSAARKMFYDGNSQVDLEPLNTSSPRQMYKDVLAGCDHAFSCGLSEDKFIQVQGILEEAKEFWPSIEIDALPVQEPRLDSPSY